MNQIKILFNGIPSSGKTTFARRLHLALEWLGHETVLLDDEVIKRLESRKVDTLVDYLDSPITIIASCDPNIKADVKFWCDIPIKEAEKRNIKKLQEEGAPIEGSYEAWRDYQGQGVKIKKWSDVCQELKTKNLNF